MENTIRMPRGRTLASAMVLVLIQLGMMLLLGKNGTTEVAMWSAATLAAIGTFAIGALNARQVPYPLWAYRAITLILAAGILVSPLTIGSPGEWRLAAMSYLWLLPWNLLILAAMPYRESARCARGKRTGWFMVGAALLLVVLLQIEGLIRLVDRAGWFRSAAL